MTFENTFGTLFICTLLGGGVAATMYEMGKLSERAVLWTVIVLGLTFSEVAFAIAVWDLLDVRQATVFLLGILALALVLMTAALGFYGIAVHRDPRAAFRIIAGRSHDDVRA